MTATDTKLPYTLENPHIKKFVDNLMSGFKQRLWMFTKLPAAWFMGVKLKSLSPEQSEVTVPYSWWSQNPFKSTYFAAQAAAAEFSTGVMSLLAIQGRGNISTLISNIQGDFVKKATSKATFVCKDAQKIFDAVDRAIETGEGQTVELESIGTQENGEIVSRFTFTWSFKVRSGK